MTIFNAMGMAAVIFAVSLGLVGMVFASLKASIWIHEETGAPLGLVYFSLQGAWMFAGFTALIYWAWQ